MTTSIELPTVNPSTLETFRQFCNDGYCRHDITQPWTANGYLYATDARTIVRTRCDAILEREREGRVPNAKSIFCPAIGEHFDASKCIHDWPEHPGFTVPMEWECDFCDGYQGFKSCWACYGKGFIVFARPAHIRIGTQLINGTFAKRIESLGNVKWYEFTRESIGFLSAGIDGRDDIEGVVMKIKEED